MKTLIKRMSVCVIILMLITIIVGAFAVSADTNTAADTAVSQTAETIEEADNSAGFKAVAAGIGVGLAALGGAIGMGLAISKSAEGIARQPEAEGKIRSALMIGLVFIETAIIYALVVAILVIFVL